LLFFQYHAPVVTKAPAPPQDRRNPGEETAFWCLLDCAAVMGGLMKTPGIGIDHTRSPHPTAAAFSVSPSLLCLSISAPRRYHELDDAGHAQGKARPAAERRHVDGDLGEDGSGEGGTRHGGAG